MREIAACENVVAKLGGLAMPDNGFGYERMAQPRRATRSSPISAAGTST